MTGGKKRPALPAARELASLPAHDVEPGAKDRDRRQPVRRGGPNPTHVEALAAALRGWGLEPIVIGERAERIAPVPRRVGPRWECVVAAGGGTVADVINETGGGLPAPGLPPGKEKPLPPALALPPPARARWGPHAGA